MKTNKKLLETKDEIFIDDFSDELCLEGKFMDGKANVKDEDGNKRTIIYPKFSELTSEQIDEIEEYTGRALMEYHQIALVFGELQ